MGDFDCMFEIGKNPMICYWIWYKWTVEYSFARKRGIYQRNNMSTRLIFHHLSANPIFLTEVIDKMSFAKVKLPFQVMIGYYPVFSE